MAWDLPVGDLGRPVANHHHRCDEPFTPLRASALTVDPTGAERWPVTTQDTAGGVNLLVDRLGSDVHVRLAVVLETECAFDLFWAPTLIEASLDCVTQLDAGLELAEFRPGPASSCGLLRCKWPILTCLGMPVAEDLPGDCRPVTSQLVGDRGLAPAGPERIGDHDAFRLGEKPVRRHDRGDDRGVVKSVSIAEVNGSPVAPSCACPAVDPDSTTRFAVRDSLVHQPKVLVAFPGQCDPSGNRSSLS